MIVFGEFRDLSFQSIFYTQHIARFSLTTKNSTTVRSSGGLIYDCSFDFMCTISHPICVRMNCSQLVVIIDHFQAIKLVVLWRKVVGVQSFPLD